MPNICHNKLKIVGNKESIDEIIKSNFSFSYFIPPPLNSTTDWYVENWCADREAFNIEFNRDEDDVLYIICKTAYTVPITFLKKLIEIYPDLYIFNQYRIEFTDCGIVILYFYNDEVIIKEFTWFDPPCKDYIKGLYEE